MRNIVSFFVAKSSQSGITLIELLLVIALVAILGATSTPFLSRFVLVNRLQTSTNELQSSLRKAQQYAMDNRSNQTWGVCITGNVIRLYGGTCASPAHQEDFSFSNNISILGMSDISFNQRGEPSTAVTITLTSSIDSATVSVNQAGGISQ